LLIKELSAFKPRDGKVNFEEVKNKLNEIKSERSSLMMKKDENEVDIYIYSDTVDMFSQHEEYYEMNFNTLDEDIELGVVVIENNEIIKPLKNIQRLLDKKDHYGCETVDDLVNVMCSLLIEANIVANSVHSELIMKNQNRLGWHCYMLFLK
jgi:hypothetical protein